MNKDIVRHRNVKLHRLQFVTELRPFQDQAGELYSQVGFFGGSGSLFRGYVRWLQQQTARMGELLQL